MSVIKIDELRSSPQISIIIPALNEEKTIAKTIDSVKDGFNVEVIVVDGGSSDKTVYEAKSAGAQIIKSQPPRSSQMNKGAEEAKGEILLFLHADTILPSGYELTVRGTLDYPEICAGAFRFKLDEESPSLSRIEKLANFRSEILKMPYGDQGIFLKKSLFDEVGGFPEMPIMEDFEFVRRVRKYGDIFTAPFPAITSARRWKERGVLKTTLINQLMIVGYYLGISPEKLRKWYNG